MTSILIAVGVVILLAIIFGFPFILKLKVSKNITFNEVDEKNNLILDENQASHFLGVTLEKDENKNVYNSLVFKSYEGTNFAYITIIYKQKNKFKIKRVCLNFKGQQDIEIYIKNGFEEVYFYVNQMDDEPYKNKMFEYIKKSQIITYICLQCIFVTLFIADVIACSFMICKSLQYFDWQIIFIFLAGALLAAISYPIIYVLTTSKYSKYVKGGFIDERN